MRVRATGRPSVGQQQAVLVAERKEIRKAGEIKSKDKINFSYKEWEAKKLIARQRLEETDAKTIISNKHAANTEKLFISKNQQDNNDNEVLFGSVFGKRSHLHLC